MPTKKAGQYVDGYVLPISKKQIKNYRKMASYGGKIWKKHGALAYFECVGEDLKPDMGGEKIMTFPELTKMKSTETVIFAFIVFKSKTHRNSVNKKVHAEMMKNYEKYKDVPMPFEVKRMAYGGFKTMVGL